MNAQYNRNQLCGEANVENILFCVLCVEFLCWTLNNPTIVGSASFKDGQNDVWALCIVHELLYG